VTITAPLRRDTRVADGIAVGYPLIYREGRVTEQSFRGRYFEEFEVGNAFETAERTVGEGDILAFAALSGDNNPLHVDPQYAATTQFGRQIAHGLLGLSIASGLAWQTGVLEGTTEALTAVDWKFRAPIFIGDTVRLRLEVKQKKAVSRLGAGFVVVDVQLLNQDGVVVQKGTWTVLVRLRPEGPGPAASSAP